MMNGRATLVVVSAVMLSGLALAAPPSHAQDRDGRRDGGLFNQIDVGLLSIGGRATYFDPENLTTGDEWHGGAQVRLHPSRYFAFEGSADYRQGKLNGTTVHSYPVQVSLLIYPLGTPRLAPFLLGGGGWYYTTVTGPADFQDTQNRFGWHAGGGLQLFLNRHWSIDGTYRHIWMEDVQSKHDDVFDKNYGDGNHMVTIGLNFHF